MGEREGAAAGGGGGGGVVESSGLPTRAQDFRDHTSFGLKTMLRYHALLCQATKK